MFHERGLVVICGSVAGSGSDAAALINGHVHDCGTFFHGFYHIFRYQFRSQRARNEDGTDQQVGLFYCQSDVVGIGEQGLEFLAVYIVQLA